jgi:hypothetical protein
MLVRKDAVAPMIPRITVDAIVVKGNASIAIRVPPIVPAIVSSV